MAVLPVVEVEGDPLAEVGPDQQAGHDDGDEDGGEDVSALKS